MKYFKRRTIHKQLRELSNEELIDSFRLFIAVAYAYPYCDLFEIIQLTLEEVHIRDGCDILLLKELEELCLNGIVTPYFVLEEVVLCELAQFDIKDLLKRQIATNNLRNWIKFTYTKGLRREVMTMVSDADIDRMEQSLREGYKTLNPL